MPFQSVPDTVEVDVLYTLNGDTVQNVFYAEFPGGYVQANLDALAVKVDTRVQGNFLIRQPIEAVYQRTEIRGLDVEFDLTASFTTGPTSGLDASPTLPNNVTLAIKQSSGLTGRSARGRCYFIGVPQDKLDPTNENLILAAHVTNLVAAVGQIRAGIDSEAGWNAVLVSRVSAGVKRPLGMTFPWISEVAVDNRVDSQRGRLPRM